VRQFFSPRFWAAIGGVLGLFLVAALVARGSDEEDLLVGIRPDTEQRRIDIVEPVFSVEAAPGFRMSSTGTATTEMRLFLDGVRVVVIKPGTPGDIRCEELAELAKCVVVADLLGDAVLWFSLLPIEPRRSITMPSVAEIGDDGWVTLSNGWEVRHAPKIERNCESEETGSLREFIRRFGEDATATFDFRQQRVTRVNCNQDAQSE
jgi:hypothetical protein